MRIGWLWFWIAFSAPLVSQEFRDAEFERILSGLEGKRLLPIGALTVSVGQTFLGKPYLERTLEGEGPEKLVVFFDGFDCVTFVESCLAIARTLKTDRPNFLSFRQQLKSIRYRGGAIDGYPSRLHYFCDWGSDNARMGIVRDMTRALGGIPYEKTVNFMTTHRGAYPKLANDGFFQRMKLVEADIDAENRHYLPKDRISEVEARIENGDILAIASTVAGLDVAHVGLAFRMETGRLHLLHASSGQMKVAVTPEPLADYLKKHGSQSGIMVFRPL